MKERLSNLKKNRKFANNPGLLFFLFSLILVIGTCGISDQKNIYSIIKHRSRVLDEYGFAGGIGNKDNPFLIENAAQLDNMREFLGNNYSDYYFKLNADIDLKDWLSDSGLGYNDGKGWEPIGNNSNQFHGHFDGGFHEIRNLWLNRSEKEPSGLFGFITGASIINLHILLDSEKGILGGAYTGTIAGYAIKDVDKEAEITNCSAKGSIGVQGSDGLYTLGGLFGEIHGYTISECYFSGEAIFEDADQDYWHSVGGLVGRAAGIRIENCYVNAAVAAESAEDHYPYAAGFIGSYGGYGSGETIISSSYVIHTGDQLFFPFVGKRGPYFGPSPTITLEGCYCSSEPSAIDEISGNGQDGFQRLTDEQMKQRQFFKNEEGNEWDFNSIWGIWEDEGYPFLKKFDNAVRIVPSSGNDVYDGISKMPVLEQVRFEGGYDTDHPITISREMPKVREMIDAGFYEVEIDYKTIHDYQMTIGRFQIRKAILTVRALPLRRGIYAVNPFADYRITGFVNNEDEILAGIIGLEDLTYISSATNKRGSYEIVINPVLSSANYDFVYESGTITLTGLYNGEIIWISCVSVFVFILSTLGFFWFAVKKKTIWQLGSAIKNVFIRTETVIKIETVIKKEMIYVEKKSSAIELLSILTAKEKEIAMELLAGTPRAQIAAKHFISEGTVRNHIEHIYRKTNCVSQIDFILKYKEAKVKEKPE